MIKLLNELNKLEGKDFEDLSAKDFQDVIDNILSKYGRVWREVVVEDRGDGKRGRIDLVLLTDKDSLLLAFEIDRKTERKKSVFKLEQYPSQRSYVLLRSPFRMIRIK